MVDSHVDNLLAEFASVVDATQSAVAIQRELKIQNNTLPAHRRMAFRMGINLGDVIVDGNNIYGNSVKLVARLAGPGVGPGALVPKVRITGRSSRFVVNYWNISNISVD